MFFSNHFNALAIVLVAWSPLLVKAASDQNPHDDIVEYLVDYLPGPNGEYLGSFPYKGEAGNPDGSWTDSYSFLGRCYCKSGYDHGLSTMIIDTPVGQMTIPEVCDYLGPGPGDAGNPVYNDIQCGNGPPNDHDVLDEQKCPGRVDLGYDGCNQIGPKWNFDIESAVPPPCTGYCQGGGGVFPFGCNAGLDGNGVKSYRCGKTGGCFYDKELEAPVGMSETYPNHCVFKGTYESLLAYAEEYAGITPAPTLSPAPTSPPVPTAPTPKPTPKPTPGPTPKPTSAPTISPAPTSSDPCAGYCGGKGGVWPFGCATNVNGAVAYKCGRTGGCSYPTTADGGPSSFCTYKGVGVGTGPGATGPPPTKAPVTTGPTAAPTTGAPSAMPSSKPTAAPVTIGPTDAPTTGAPSANPSAKPTAAPTTGAPTESPSQSPTGEPSESPTPSPTSSILCSGFCTDKGGVWPYGCAKKLNGVVKYMCHKSGGCYYAKSMEDEGPYNDNSNFCVYLYGEP